MVHNYFSLTDRSVSSWLASTHYHRCKLALTLWYFYNTGFILGVCVGGEGVCEGEIFVGTSPPHEKLNQEIARQA